MTSKKYYWCTSFDRKYYQLIFQHVIDGWSLLPGTQTFYADNYIAELIDDARVQTGRVDFSMVPDQLTSKELKFWQKALCIACAVKDSLEQDFDYCIWLDADVQITRQPLMKSLLPRCYEILSVINKTSHNGFLGLDTGFMAINLRHKKLDQWLELYENIWMQPELQDMERKYDTNTLDYVLKTLALKYRNLWSGTHGKGKSYCGFEHTNLDRFFIHYWGKKHKSLLIEENKV